MAYALSFYLIEGISREDTPIFDSYINQQEWFNARVLKKYETDVFYPPYYTNRIKLNSDDIDFNRHYNYLSISYNNITYYYFISSVSYISEDVVELYIEMDTVQTFMFYTTFIRGILERLTINRWTSDGKINREYIRENFSNNDLRLIEKHRFESPSDFESVDADKLEDDETNYVIIFKFTEKLEEDKIGYDDNEDVNKDYLTKQNIHFPNGNIGRGISCSYHYYCLPIKIDKEDGVADYFDGEKFASSEFIYSDTVFSLVTRPSLVSAYIVPLNCFDKIGMKGIKIISATSVGTTPVTYYGIKLKPANLANEGIVLRVPANITICPLTYDYIFNFVKNTNINNNFHIKYIPQLLDNNYYSINFGEGGNQANIDLFYCNTPSVQFVYYHTLDGNRYYSINPKSYTPIFDREFTYNKFDNEVVANNPFFVDAINDSWKQYYEYNKLSIPMAIAQTGISMAITFATAKYDAGLMASYQLYQAGKIISNPSHYDRRYKESHRPLKAKYANALSDLNAKYDYQSGTATSSMASTLANQAMQPLGELTRAGNAYLAPDSPKTEGSSKNDFASGNMFITYSVRQAQDIEVVARYYETYGYRVDWFVSNLNFSQFYTFYNIRYYYNYVKFRDLVLDIEALEDGSIIDDLTSRYEAGIRFWNTPKTNSQMNFYVKDNVERDNI